MAKKLTKHGNSLALIIDKPLLQLLNINEKTKLEISIDGSSLIIRPVHKKKYSKKEVKKIAEQLIEEYADVFEKLAH